MKANELRIGNLVQVDGAIVKVDSIHTSEQYNTARTENGRLYSFVLDCVEPIPLTDDWLVKFGFIEKDKWFYKEGFCIGYLTTEDNLQIEYCIAGHGGWKVLELKSVHQLQNLYFALTGEELTLK